LGQNIIDVVKQQYDSIITMAPRAWRYMIWNPSLTESILSNPKTGENMKIYGLLGLTSEETEVTSAAATLVKSRWFIPGDEETERKVFPCIISNSTARKVETFQFRPHRYRNCRRSSL
jgi:hypothetical protein